MLCLPPQQVQTITEITVHSLLFSYSYSNIVHMDFWELQWAQYALLINGKTFLSLFKIGVMKQVRFFYGLWFRNENQAVLSKTAKCLKVSMRWGDSTIITFFLSKKTDLPILHKKVLSCFIFPASILTLSKYRSLISLILSLKVSSVLIFSKPMEICRTVQSKVWCIQHSCHGTVLSMEITFPTFHNSFSS